MSILDSRLVFNDGTELGHNATAATAFYSKNTLNLGAKDLDIGAGTPLYLNIIITEAPTGYRTTQDSSCEFILQGCDTIAAWTGPTFNRKTLQQKELVVGRVMGESLALGIKSKHLRLKFRTGVNTAMTFSTSSKGKWDAWIGAAVPETDVGT